MTDLCSVSSSFPARDITMQTAVRTPVFAFEFQHLIRRNLNDARH
jgi:hypothetical protein